MEKDAEETKDWIDDDEALTPTINIQRLESNFSSVRKNLSHYSSGVPTEESKAPVHEDKHPRMLSSTRAKTKKFITPVPHHNKYEGNYKEEKIGWIVRCKLNLLKNIAIPTDVDE